MPELSRDDAIESTEGLARQSSHSRYRRRTASPHTPDRPIPSQRVLLKDTNQHSSPVWTSSSGPDYVTADETKPQPPADVKSRANLLLRALLDILIFTYDVDGLRLHEALTECSPSMHTRKLPTGHASLLTPQEWYTLMAYTEVIHKACTRISENQHSLLEDDDAASIISYIIQPARHLGIEPAYMFEQLLALRLHRCQAQNRKKTLLYTRSTSTWRGLLDKMGIGKEQKMLAYQLVSDDIAVAQLGTHTCERLRLLLGQAIKQHNHKYCKYGMGNVARHVHAGPIPTALVDELAWGEVQTKVPRPAPTDFLIPRSNAYNYSNRYPPRSRSVSSMSALRRIDERDEVPVRPQSVSGRRAPRRYLSDAQLMQEVLTYEPLRGGTAGTARSDVAARW